MKNILFYGGSSLLSNLLSSYWKDKFNIYLGLNRKWIEIPGTTSLQLNHNKVKDLEDILKKYKIDLIINLSGYTNVESCDTNHDLAYYLNGYLPGELSKVSSRLNTKLVHISTDHVFDGNDKFYSEDSHPIPINIYAKSKLLGETEVLKNNKEAIVIRTNFFGNGPSYRPSFSDKIISYLSINKQIELFDDVFYSPVHANELANCMLELVKLDAKGIFNICSNERVSKFEFGLMIADYIGKNSSLIKPIKIKSKKNLIIRPKDMSLSNKKYETFTKKNINSLKNQIKNL